MTKKTSKGRVKFNFTLPLIYSNIYSGGKLLYNNGGLVADSNNQQNRITTPLTHFATRFCEHFLSILKKKAIHPIV